MKIFISYRRDDTAGRAGRLFDVLVTRFGARNVFQDVTAIEPGVDFAKRVDEAIAGSDAVLVVIGADWLATPGPDGSRRLDDPDDYVRREVSAALRAGARVVPILVNDARLPAVTDLPDDLQPLASRQSVALGDATWHQDVDALIRRLEGEQVVDTPRRRSVMIGAAVVLIAVTLFGWVWLRGGGADGSKSNSGEPPPCPVPDGSWTEIDVPETATVEDPDGGTLTVYTVTAASYIEQSSLKTLIVLTAELSNETPDENSSGSNDGYYNWAVFRALNVNGIAQGEPSCFSLVSGDPTIEPGERAIGLVGFESSEDPASVSLVVETINYLKIDITPSA